MEVYSLAFPITRLPSSDIFIGTVSDGLLPRAERSRLFRLIRDPLLPGVGLCPFSEKRRSKTSDRQYDENDDRPDRSAGGR